MNLSLKSYVNFLVVSILTLTANISLAAIELAVEANPNPARHNETVSVGITVTNSGSSPSGIITLRMQWIGDYLLNLSNSLISDGGVCASVSCNGDEFVDWTLNTLKAGETRTVTLPPTIWNVTPIGTSIPFKAEVFENGIKLAESTATVVVEADPPFDIAVDEDANPVSPGADLIYTISYSNRGATSAIQTGLSFPLPAGTSFIAATDGETPINGVVSWELGTLPGQSGGEKKVHVRVNNGLAQGNLLEVDAAEITGLVNSLPYTSSAMAVSRVENNAPLSLGLEQNPDPVQHNETLNTTLTVTNVSGGPLFGVTLRLRWLGNNLLNLNNNLISDGGTCDSVSCNGSEFVTWMLGKLNAGETRAVTLTPAIWNVTALGELLTFNILVTEDGQRKVEQSHTVRVQNAPPFDIAVDEDVNPAASGENLVYTISYSNRGTTSAIQTGLSFPLPAGTSFIAATDGETPVSDVVSWDLGTLPGQSGGEKKVRVRVNNGLALGSLLEVDAAEITGLVNSLPYTSSAMAVTRVESNVPLLLGLEQNPDPVQHNETLNTALTVTNASGGQLFGVTLQLRWLGNNLLNLNNNLISDGGTCDSVSCNGNEFVSWTLGTMNAGETRTVNLSPVIWNATPLGELLTFNTLVIEDEQRKVEQSHTVRIQNAPPFDIAVDEDTNPAAPGEDLIYTISYSNRGTTSATQTGLSFPLPSGASFVSATDGETPVDGVVSWDLGTLSRQSGGEKKVRVRVNSGLAQGSLLEVNAAEITGLVNSLPYTSSAMVVTSVEIDAPLLLGLEQNPDPVQHNESLDTDLAVMNVSGRQLLGVTLQLRWLGSNLLNLSNDLISDGGTCASVSCNGNEFVTWTLGAMNVGETRTVKLPPVIWNATPLGELLTFNSVVTEDSFAQSISSNTVFVGTNFEKVPDPPVGGVDTDGDGIEDADDNCIEEPNGPNLGPNIQLDTDGDGYGNVCDGDLDNSNFVNSIDFSIFKQRLLSDDLDADLDGNGIVNSIDFSKFKTLLLRPPGPSGVAP